MPSRVIPVLLADLSAWPTRRLLALQDRLLRCEASIELSDVQHADEIDPSVIRFKDDPRWTELYSVVMSVLSAREHVPSAAESKQARQARGREGRFGKRARPKRTPR